MYLPAIEQSLHYCWAQLRVDNNKDKRRTKTLTKENTLPGTLLPISVVLMPGIKGETPRFSFKNC